MSEPVAAVHDLSSSRTFAGALVASMTVEEKAAQMAQIERGSITPDEVAELGIGSVLSGGGGNPDPNTPENWARMVDPYLDGARRSRLGIPLLYGTDAVHGHANVVGATIFPHNIGLGASHDPALVEQVYRATAVETAATGARWAFAPAVSVALDPRWGRTYESFGDDPALVTSLGAAAVRGLVGRPGDPGSVLACCKHFVGDGGTRWGSVPTLDWIDWWDEWGQSWQIDQGDLPVDEATLRSVHLEPYRAGLAAGALTVMASYSSWRGEKVHGSRWLLTGLLKDELGFPGFVVSDWLGVAQLDPDPARAAATAIGAGIDMVMVPFDFRGFIGDVVGALQAGHLDQARVDDAVERIITVKHALGLFSTDPPARPPVGNLGSDQHRRLGRKAVAASAVLLTNDDATLPLTGGPILVAGVGADDIGLQCGGWSIEWQGATGPITTGTTIVDGLRQCRSNRSGLDASAGVEIEYRPDGSFPAGTRAPVGIAVVAEPPYAEGQGDQADLGLPDDDVALVERLRARVDRLVLVVISGRPLILDRVLAHCDAVVAAWLPGTEGAGLAEVITGAEPFRGRLPRPWPGSPGWSRGHGERT